MRYLIFKLFGGINGVGFYNQIYSLELAIYLSYISNRKLILIIDKPLAIMGINDWSVGTIFDYINDISHLLKEPYEIHIRKNNILESYQYYHIQLPKKISSCIIVDSKYNNEEHSNIIEEFSNGRINVSDIINEIYENHKYVHFSDSNASRFFYNFYTTIENYKYMSTIAYSLSCLPEKLQNYYNNIKKYINYDYIAIHLRFGDKHICEEKKIVSNNRIYENIITFMNHNHYNYNLIIMTDFKENPIFVKLKSTYNIIFSDELIKSTCRENINEIESFLLQKKICESGIHFLGSQTSTVSCHIQYVRYIHNKSYNHYVNGRGKNFDNKILKYNKIQNKRFNWSSIQYPKGHHLSWQLFFEDNVYTNDKLFL